MPVSADGFRPLAAAEGDITRACRIDAVCCGRLQWHEVLASRTHPRWLMTLEEMANPADLMASDKARGLTGTIVAHEGSHKDSLGVLRSLPEDLGR
jgi:hypothetical protein